MSISVRDRELMQRRRRLTYTPNLAPAMQAAKTPRQGVAPVWQPSLFPSALVIVVGLFLTFVFARETRDAVKLRLGGITLGIGAMSLAGYNSPASF